MIASMRGASMAYSAHAPTMAPDAPVTNENLIEQAYAAYNRQDTGALLALVGNDVHWPDGQRHLRGKQELRTYWTRQWAETRTRDEVLEIAAPMANRLTVRVRQIVCTLAGAVISTGTFEHNYLIEDGLIMRLDIRRL